MILSIAFKICTPTMETLRYLKENLQEMSTSEHTWDRPSPLLISNCCAAGSSCGIPKTGTGAVSGYIAYLWISFP